MVNATPRLGANLVGSNPPSTAPKTQRMIKVASTTRIVDRLEFHEWLNSLPFHTPLIRRLSLWTEARDKTIGVWVEDEPEEFFFY